MSLRFIALVFMLLASLALFTSDMVTGGKIITFTRASYEPVSYEKSFVSVFPKDLPNRNGNATANIKVFVRANKTGNLVSGRIVDVKSTLGRVNPEKLITNKSGTGVFTFSCNNQKGVAEITALIDNRELPRKVTVRCN